MAYIEDNQGRVIHLAQYHTLGRLRYSVDTVIDGAEISRYHAVIEWINDHWMIKDISTNGVWINQNKIPKNQYVVLNAGDSLIFGSINGKSFNFTDSHPPEDMLYLFDEEEGESASNKVICLQSYNMLPNDDAPRLALYKNKGDWWSEDLQGTELHERCLKDRDLISIEGTRWQLRLAQLNEQTQNLEESKIPLDQLIAEFHVSQDEENVQLSMSGNGESVDLSVRNYHYLSLYLARRRIADEQNGNVSSERGWVYREDAAKELGMDEMHLNLHIHRARKQLAKSLNFICNASSFIECRPGQIRFGEMPCRILKADVVEHEVPIHHPFKVG